MHITLAKRIAVTKARITCRPIYKDKTTWIPKLHKTIAKLDKGTLSFKGNECQRIEIECKIGSGQHNLDMNCHKDHLIKFANIHLKP